MEQKVRRLLGQFAEIEEALGQPDVFSDQKQYRALTQKHSYLSEVKKCWEGLEDSKKQLSENREMLAGEQDPEFLEVLEEDISKLEKKTSELETQLEHLLIPPDPNDHRPIIMELRAGTGGDEAALFVGDCIRMYKLFADMVGWNYELLSCSPSDVGGYRECVMVFSGKNVHRLLQYEGGIHRVQRVPETESQGRVHTSAISIAVLMEPDEEEDIEIDEKELRTETYRASGAGGQHVNTTDSAVRVTHMPTGLVAYCQEGRSQHKNKEKAMRLLKAKIVEQERSKKEAEIANKRSEQVGSGDRSGRIRTYNFSQNRLTDHRINLTLYSLDRAMNGELNEVVTGLVAHYRQKQLEA
jgi:peptide chain release factor 1